MRRREGDGGVDVPVAPVVPSAAHVRRSFPFAASTAAYAHAGRPGAVGTAAQCGSPARVERSRSGHSAAAFSTRAVYARLQSATTLPAPSQKHPARSHASSPAQHSAAAPGADAHGVSAAAASVWLVQSRDAACATRGRRASVAETTTASVAASELGAERAGGRSARGRIAA